MDFAIEMTADRAAESFTKADTIFNNIFLSLAIEQGSWWLDPTFGLRSRGRLKNTAATARLLEQDCKNALQWIIDTGRADSIDIATERDQAQDLGRLKLLIVATQADGRRVTFTKFIEVV